MGICLTFQITDQSQQPQWCQSCLSTSFYLTSLLSLVPQTISLVSRLVIVLINVHFVKANCLILCNPSFICACCVFRCLERIRSSTTHEIICETNSKKGANVFCAPTDTLVQRTKDANKVGQAFL